MTPGHDIGADEGGRAEDGSWMIRPEVWRVPELEDPATGTAVETLRQAIQTGEYLPGERLVEAQLCDRLRTGRFAVRAALRELAAEGLVELQRNRGAQVRKVSLAEAIEITEARRALEGLVAARAAQNVTPERARELDEIGLLMRRAVASGEHARYHELNQQLHLLVRRMAGHRTADSLIEMLRGQLARHHLMLSMLPGRSATSLPEHEQIIVAIIAGDAEQAESAMRNHIRSVIEALRTMESFPDAGR